MVSLQTRLADLITAIGTDWKNQQTKIGDLTTLTTTVKTSLVAAINEVNAKPSGTGGALIADGDAGTSTTTTYSASKIKALNDTQDTVIAGKAVISDSSATNATTTTYSANKINIAIAAAVANLVNGASTTLDTLSEIATALGNDANFATTITAALGNRVRFDAAQSLTAPQKAQVKTNIDALGTLEIGDPNTDLVALYVTAKS